jgi:hypothetical protein
MQNLKANLNWNIGKITARSKEKTCTKPIRNQQTEKSSSKERHFGQDL